MRGQGVKYEEKARQKVALGGLGCPWVLPGLTCSYTPSYLPVGGSRSQWTPTQCWCRWQWWWWTCSDIDRGGLNLISVPSKKAAGGKRQFLSKYFLPHLSRVSVLQSLDGKCRRPFLHLTAKEEERCLHFVLTVWLSVWEKGRWLACSTSLPLYPDTHSTQLLLRLLPCSALADLSRKHDTQSEPPLLPLSNPNLFFLHNLRFKQIRLICQISILAHFQIGLISYKLTNSVPISSDLCLTSICSKSLRKTWEFWRQSVKPFFCSSSQWRRQKAPVLQSAWEVHTPPIASAET